MENEIKSLDERHRLIVGQDQLSLLPRKTGCYVFITRDPVTEKEVVIYVGKAKSLRDRVKNYFASSGDSRAFVKYIREFSYAIEYILTETERDALVLENELIKRLKPRYNIMLKDSKTYLSLRLDIKHEWPRVEATRKIRKDSAVYMGPFSSSQKLRETLNFMQKLFPLRSCPDAKLYNRSRPCIEYDIKRCVAPCVNYVTKTGYQSLVESAMLFLKGQNEELLKKLYDEMQTSVEAEKYEDAAKIRDQIQSIEYITNQRTQVVGLNQRKLGINQDAIFIARDNTRATASVVFVRNGVVWDQRSLEFSISAELDDHEVLAQFIERFYSGDVYIPNEILVAHELKRDLFGISANVLVPRNEEKKAFLSMAERNADIKLQVKLKKAEKISEVLEELQSKLKLLKRPSRMDCFDISHHQGSEVVASVVRFFEGSPQKDFYRKIKIQTAFIDDFASMKEAISRRYKTKEDLPDLIVIDGGKGQLSSALKALEELGFVEGQDIVALAKARPTEEEIDPLNPMNRERVFKPGRMNPILLKESSAPELLLTFLRDEAHRFAISFHRQRKEKLLSISMLDEIPGLSARMKLRLLKNFGSIEGIRGARDEDLLKVVKPKLLASIREYLERG